MLALVIVEGVAVALLGVLVAGLLRSHADILRQLHELTGGRSAGARTGPQDIDFTVRPDLAAPTDGDLPATLDLVGVTPYDEAIAVDVTGAGHDTLLAFLSSGCLTCGHFWTEFQRDPATLGLPAAARLVVVTKGPDDESESAVRTLAPAHVPVVMSSEAWTGYDVPVSPYFAYVGVGGRVLGAGAAASWPQVVNLLTNSLADIGAAARPALAHDHQPGADQRDNAARADAELLAAGIHPGHPSLYPPAHAADRAG